MGFVETTVVSWVHAVRYSEVVVMLDNAQHDINNKSLKKTILFLISTEFF